MLCKLRSNIRAFVLPLIGAIWLANGFASYAALPADRSGALSNEQSQTCDALEIDFSGVIYRFPDEYVGNSGSCHRISVPHPAVTMLLHLPDLEPRNNANEADFDVRGWYRQLLLTMDSPMNDPVDAERHFMPGSPFRETTEAELKSEKLGEVGPGVYDLKRKNLFFDLFALVEQGKVINYIQCFPYVFRGEKMSPYCQIDENIHGVIRLRLSFSRSFLDQTKNIHERIMKLLASFELHDAKAVGG